MGATVSRAGMLPILALQVLGEYSHSDSRPPVTAALLLANVLIHLRWPPLLDRALPPLDEVWFNPYLIMKLGSTPSLYREEGAASFRPVEHSFQPIFDLVSANTQNRDLKRFFLSAFYHIGEPHLFYNMMSLLWKGIQLETSMGSVEFASMVAALLAMSQGITLLLAKSLFLFFDYERAYYYDYAVGFSGVLFAMKVVLNSQYSDNFTYVHGIIVPSRYAAWAELLLIQMFVPGVSFLGHLGGILAGLLYLRLKGSYSGSDPLTSLIKGAASVLTWPVRLFRGMFRRPRISGRGTVGGGQPRRGVSGVWRCPVCTYDNSGWSNVCEMCSTERNDHGFSSRRMSGPADLSLEELRRRRLERFDR